MLFGWLRPRFATLREKARKALEAGDFSRAIRLSEEALQRGVDEPEAARQEVESFLYTSKNNLARANLERARGLSEQDLFAEAEEAAELALSLAQEPALRQEIDKLLESLSRLEGDISLMEEMEEAREAFWEGHIVKVPSSLRSAYHRLADQLREPLLAEHGGSPENALPILDRLVETEPLARYERALCRFARKDLDGAISDLEVLLASLEEDPVLYRAAARAYTERAVPGRRQNLAGEEMPSLIPSAEQDLEKAAEYLTNALDLSSRDGALYVELLEVFFLLRKLDRARQVAKVGLRRVEEPLQRRKMLAGLGRVEIAAERMEAAEAALKEALRVMLSSQERWLDPEASLLLVWLLLVRGERLERALLLTEALKECPEREDQCWAFLYEGQILLSLEKPEEARARFETARRLAEPRSPEEQEADKALRLLSGATTSPYR